MPQLHVVTGAFGYSGRYIARRLLDEGHRVRTLTNSAMRDSFGGRVEVYPLNFSDAEALEKSLHGATVLYNTYWVRFNYKGFTHEQAVANTRVLFAAAARAGVERIVHVSITNPDPRSSLSYFRGKARLEEELARSGFSHAIIRPAVLFGGAPGEDILINNIAWALRRFPFFPVFGDGNYRLQPIHVEDFAAIMLEQGLRRQNITIDAIGPETYSYRELVREIGRAIGHPRRIVGIPPWLAYALGKPIGWWHRDVFITRDEIRGLMADLLYTPSDPPANAVTRLSVWAANNAETLGRVYASELSRRR